MGQIAYERFPLAEVTFTLKNRTPDLPLSQYVDSDELCQRLNEISIKGFSHEEIVYLESLKTQNGKPRFDEPYLRHLSHIQLPYVSVCLDEKTNDLSIHTKGRWADVSLWETVVMSEVNEQYYRNLVQQQGMTTEAIWAEGDRRLDQKIRLLKMRPDIKFSDFGTRRRFSKAWHDHVVGRLADELPSNFVGTSNPWCAYTYNLQPIGTYAHEMPMVYAAMAEQQGRNPLSGHTDMMTEWYERYGDDLSIALTDTFTSEFFFADFTVEQAESWHGLRHDSGDPIEFGERAIAFYEEHGIIAANKTIVFSDGLDIETIIHLADHFKGRVSLMFGWGTNLMNDLGLRPNNFVMKATNANGVYTVKLSDNIGKYTGPATQIDRYIKSAMHIVQSTLKIAPVL